MDYLSGNIKKIVSLEAIKGNANWHSGISLVSPTSIILPR
jgi:hypothetical protein